MEGTLRRAAICPNLGHPKARSGKLRPTAAFLALCLAAVYVVALPENPGEKVALVVFPRPETGAGYRLFAQLDAEGGRNPFGPPLSQSVSVSGEIDLNVDRSFRDYIFTGLTTPGIALTLNTDGKIEGFLLRTEPEEPVEVIFSRTGRVRAIRNIKPLEKRNGAYFSIADILQNGFPVFPDKPVSPGDTWTDRKELGLPWPGMPLTVAMDALYTLNNIVPKIEGRSALISAISRVTLSGRRDAGVFSVVIEGTGEGHSVLNFEIDSGRIAEYSVDYAVLGTVKVLAGGQELVTSPFRFTSTYALSIIRTSLTSRPGVPVSGLRSKGTE